MEGLSYLTNLPEFKEVLMELSDVLKQMILFMTGLDIDDDRSNTTPPASRGIGGGSNASSSGKGKGMGTVSDFGFIGAMYNLTFDKDKALSADDKVKVEQLEKLHEKVRCLDGMRSSS
tara:strand:+ start:408 stop:761 length:354 start_codon:yes stop_codon:yes gene_type:complete